MEKTSGKLYFFLENPPVCYAYNLPKPRKHIANFCEIEVRVCGLFLITLILSYLLSYESYNYLIMECHRKSPRVYTQAAVRLTGSTVTGIKRKKHKCCLTAGHFLEGVHKAIFLSVRGCSNRLILLWMRRNSVRPILFLLPFTSKIRVCGLWQLCSPGFIFNKEVSQQVRISYQLCVDIAITLQASHDARWRLYYATCNKFLWINLKQTRSVSMEFFSKIFWVVGKYFNWGDRFIDFITIMLL